ncbi:MAG: cytidylate kinase [Peptococcaceae bacterium BICA1-8]|nr:MAG: cytidylate kinase [Peptococcaceae bacterium BICA1-8]
MKETIKIAIDGPAGAGKSTVAKILAQKLEYIYIDTGAMYRALTYKIIQLNLDFNDTASLIICANNTSITLDNSLGVANQLVYCDGKDVTELIRTPAVNKLVSVVAQISEIRTIMVKIQRQLGLTNNIIMDGRDIGTVVLPEAKYKFFLTAALEERAKRRQKELLDKGYNEQYKAVMNDLFNRDLLDTTRETAPLKIPEDAIIIDTSSLTLTEVVEKILATVMEGEKDAL